MKYLLFMLIGLPVLSPISLLLQSHQHHINWSVVSPVTAEEIKVALHTMGKTSAGMDRWSAQEVLSWHLPSVAGLMNIILATERLPASLSCARVASLPKVECPEDPSNFRPIAISSVLACALHKVLSRRMREGFQFFPF